MKISTIGSGLLSLSLASTVLADFHILELDGTTDKYAIPSNKYNCGGVEYALNNNDQINGAIGSSYLSLRNANLCGVKNLDFYRQSDGSYKFYIAGGDGTVQGQCYHNEDSGGEITNCSETWGITLVEKLICYTYICN
ncbi:hypothetical protein V1525DRAFT_419440 [Lipomyces kononenkoae]|uniref:Uncharacterized protein n=1 Tax=Lipomyces kononenkoae TaxID=34357 RepID=A0ACC3T0V0_LIPKO